MGSGAPVETPEEALAAFRKFRPGAAPGESRRRSDPRGGVKLDFAYAFRTRAAKHL